MPGIAAISVIRMISAAMNGSTPRKIFVSSISGNMDFSTKTFNPMGGETS